MDYLACPIRYSLAISTTCDRVTGWNAPERTDVSHFVPRSIALFLLRKSSMHPRTIFEGPTRPVLHSHLGGSRAGTSTVFLNLTSAYLRHKMSYCLYLTFTHSCDSSHGVNTSESGVHERVRSRARGRPQHLISYG